MVWTCASSRLMVSSPTLPQGWLKLELEKSDGTKTNYIVCSMWQAVDLIQKISNS